MLGVKNNIKFWLGGKTCKIVASWEHILIIDVYFQETANLKWSHGIKGKFTVHSNICVQFVGAYFS